MTLTEFLHPIIKNPIRDKCLATLYFQKKYHSEGPLTEKDLRPLLMAARVPRAATAKISDCLRRSGGPYVDMSGRDGRLSLWEITSTGEQYIEKLLSLSSSDVEKKSEISDLNDIVESLSDSTVAEYVQEGIDCLEAGALRAAVVFLWVGVIYEIQKLIISSDSISNINNFIQKHDPKARRVSRLEDLCYLKESKLLLLSQDLGIFDKNEKGILEEALNLRNKCGHPGKYKLGPKKVSSFIEDIVGIVFS